MTSQRRDQLRRIGALVLCLLGVPLILTLGSLLQESPIRVGAPSPRTVIAPDQISIDDPEGTQAARAAAAEAVQPVLVRDEEASGAIVRTVRETFDTVAEVRGAVRDEAADGAAAGADAPAAGNQPTGSASGSLATDVPTLGGPADESAPIARRLRAALPFLDADAVGALATLSDEQVSALRIDGVQIAQEYARGAHSPDAVESDVESVLRQELALRSLPPGTARGVIDPILRQAAQPTLREDPNASAAAREQAAADVADITQTWARGAVIVGAGEQVSDVQLAALRSRNLDGADPVGTLVRAVATALLVTFACGQYLRAYRTRVWRQSRLLLLLSILFAAQAAAVEVVSLIPDSVDPVWHFVAPVAAVAMLATILIDPPVGVLSAIPAGVLTFFALPGEPAMYVFVVLSCLGVVPLVSQLSARGDLRKGTTRAVLGLALLAMVSALIFVERDAVPLAAAAGLVGGLIVSLLVIGLLPFLESSFGVATATSLLDLADRNHPLLRQLESKALGSYNHSILVATLVERAARAIGANALLASVCALYHDIGKTKRPYFFVENQIGTVNPHDKLPPAESAGIIREHVRDGVALAEEHKLPPAVIEGIAAHHGTTLVAFFHRKALLAADDDADVDEADYRYPGPKPGSREVAVLMLADSCEGAARAAAQADGKLSQEQLEKIVTGLVTDRVEDGQLDDSSLTFSDLRRVVASFTETLRGVYHPRISYPDKPEPRPPRSPLDGEPLTRGQAQPGPADATPPVGDGDGPVLDPRVGVDAGNG